MTVQLNGRSTRALLIAGAIAAGSVSGWVSTALAQVPPTTMPAGLAPGASPQAAPPQAAGAPAAAPVAAPAAAPAPPSPDMIVLKQMLDDKNYADLVKQSTKLLAAKDDPTVVISRFQVQMLRGEGQAGLKLPHLAVDTFKAAAKETKDPKEIALSKWTAELFERSSGLAYIPKKVEVGGKRPDPIPLLDLSQRTDAFQALLDDELSAMAPKIKIASTSQNLPTIMPVVEKLVELNQLDDIANGNDEKTAKAANDLLSHSKGLLVSAVKSMWARDGDLETAANKTTAVPTQANVNGLLTTVNGTKKVGLTRDQIAELHNTIDTCAKVHDAANPFLEMAKSDDGWSALMNDSDRVAAKANDILSADYSAVTPDLTGTTATGTPVNGNGTLYQNGTPVIINGVPVYNNNDTYLPGTSFPVNTPIPQSNTGTGGGGTGGTGTGGTGGTGTTTSGGSTPAAPSTPTAPTTPTTPVTPTTPTNPSTTATPPTPTQSTPPHPRLPHSSTKN